MRNAPKLRLYMPEFSLFETLFCGQSFSWKNVSDEKQTEPTHFVGIAENRGVLAYMEDDFLVLQNLLGSPFSSEDEQFWNYYFATDENYVEVKKLFNSIPALKQCVALNPGLRVLRQPFFDTLISFIISQNNHIPRITGIVNRLCFSFGNKIWEEHYSFPSSMILAKETVESLVDLRAGFRAKYILDAAKKVSVGQVNEKELKALDNENARNYLKQIYGVGNKVADCVLLYSQGRNDIAPMDVWMNRAMQELFPLGFPKEIKGYEGIAQQFIFAWARENLSK